jgi:hypothetical protein
MKRIIFFAAILLSCLTFKSADAQLRISLGLNIGSQPDWGPTGYDHAEYYYMPDIDAYYDVPNHQYVYFQNNVWVHAGALPPRYHFDPYNSYKVVVNDRNPWERAATYRAKYANYKGRRGQAVIRDSHDQKYRNHWNGNNGRGPGNNGHDNHGNDNHGNDNHGRDDHGRDHH